MAPYMYRMLYYSSPSGTLSGELDPLSEPPLPVLASLPSRSPPAGTVGESALCSPSPLTGCTLMPWLCCRRDPLGACLWWLRVCPGACCTHGEASDAATPRQSSAPHPNPAARRPCMMGPRPEHS